jgi:hypothetical protein
MGEANDETEPTEAGNDPLTDYLFDPLAGRASVGRAKKRENSSRESHADRARRILGLLTPNDRGGQPGVET